MIEKFLNEARIAELWDRIKKELGSKQNKLTGREGQIVGFDTDGNAIAVENTPAGTIKLQSIEITTPPDKIDYYAGENFDPTGMVVTGHYKLGVVALDGTVTGYAVSPAGAMAAGTTKVTITYSESGVTKTCEQPVSVVKRAVAVPTQSGSLTYNGQPQTPVWTGYDSNIMAKTETPRTDAGSSSTVFSLIYPALYQWADGSTTDKTVVWEIAKATGSMSLSDASVELNPSNLSREITVTRAGDGAISASSNNTSVASVSVSGTKVTVATVGQNSGTAVITVKVAEGTNHTAPADGTISVTAEFAHVYGVEWDGTSTTKWTRTDESAGFTDPVPYVAGATSYGSPFDGLMPWAGMVKSERAGGTMVAIPKFWYKLTQSGKSLKIQIADKPIAGFSTSPAHMDRGDGKGERDVIYVGRYHCGPASYYYKSVTGVKPRFPATRSTFRTEIHKLGSNIWQMDFATRFTIWLLYLVEFADWDSQKTIGNGCGNGSGSGAGNMGYTDSMPYHTGTTQSSRDTYGLGTQYRYIEGLWDNVYDWEDGCYNSNAGLNLILNPNSYSDSSGGVSIGTPSSGYPSAFTISNKAGFAMFYPTESSGSGTVASCDSWTFNASDPAVCVGGDFNHSGGRGLFCLVRVSVSYSGNNVGSRPQELP